MKKNYKILNMSVDKNLYEKFKNTAKKNKERICMTWFVEQAMEDYIESKGETL